MCRAVGPITTPDGEPFAEYIRKALITQLRLTRSYSPEAATRISGSLDNINFDSHEGIWRMSLPSKITPDAPSRSVKPTPTKQLVCGS